MKIRTITCHDVYNYGASLQAFALQRFLELNGDDIKIIDYKPDYLNFHYRISSYISPALYSYKPSLKHWYVRYPFIVYRYFLSLRSIGRKIKFDEFTRKYLNLTPRYERFDELSRLEQDADLYIAGSDQIWNSFYMENGKDPAFYLGFVPEEKRKIAYAASFGANRIDENKEEDIKRWLARFDKISVRELSGKSILESLNITSSLVCDPVFLLDKFQWKSLCKQIPHNPYVLIYNIGNINQDIVTCARSIAQDLSLSIVSIVDKFEVADIDKNVKNADPIDFISYILNSDFVVSNSFHSTALSLILSKQFFTFPFTSISNSTRMTNLLKTIGLMDRFNPMNIKEINNIDYSIIDGKVAEFSNNGTKWLLESLRNE